MGFHTLILVRPAAQVNIALACRLENPSWGMRASTIGAVYFPKPNGDGFFRLTAS